jgi:UDP-glucose 4-epimerase
MAKLLNNKGNYPMREIGIRQGEKIHEVLVSEEEIVRTVEYDQFYVILPYDKINESSLNNKLEEYTSRNTRILNENEIYELLKTEGWL